MRRRLPPELVLPLFPDGIDGAPVAKRLAGLIARLLGADEVLRLRTVHKMERPTVPRLRTFSARQLVQILATAALDCSAVGSHAHQRIDHP